MSIYAFVSFVNWCLFGEIKMNISLYNSDQTSEVPYG